MAFDEAITKAKGSPQTAGQGGGDSKAPQEGVPPAPGDAQAGGAGGPMGGGQQIGGLPPTGIDQQMASLNNMYQGVAGLEGVGFDPRMQQFEASRDMGAGANLQSTGAGPTGATDLNGLARTLADSYGLPIGGGNLVDASGNFLMTPDQLAAASGGQVTQGEAAAKMNYIAEAIQRQQQQQELKKSEAALQTGLGLVQSNARGSMAAMQSGMYEGLANLYQNQQHDAADFSFFIQQEQLEIQMEMQRRAEEMAKKQSRGAFIGGVLGAAGSLLMGNPMGAFAAAGQIGGAAGGTGWF